MSKLVTIGLQFYNNERTIGRAIDSLLRQTYTEFELLLHDDGSTDRSLEIAKSFSDPRIQVFSDGVNRKRPYRLNQSIDIARGEFYAVADGDDISYPDRLKEQVAFLEEHHDIDLVGTGMLVFGESGLALGKRVPPPNHAAICRRPWAGIPISQPTFCGRTQWFRRLRYDERLAVAEDQFILLRGLARSRYANIPAILVGYEELSLRMPRVRALRDSFLRAVWMVYSPRRIDLWCAAALVQGGLVLADYVASLSRLNYSIVRQRARPASSVELKEWSDVYLASLTQPGADHRRPSVTVCMQFFNNRMTLASAIVSVLNQTFSDFELILQDDGSTDQGIGVAESFSDSRIRLFRYEVNRGRAVRLNEAINMARGKYLVIMDADDIAFPDRLEKQIGFLDKNPDIDLLGGRMLVFSSTGSVVGGRFPPSEHTDICNAPFAGIAMCQPTFAGRIDWFRMYRYDPSMRRAQDQDLLLRSYRESRFHNLTDIVVGYREDALTIHKQLRDRFYYTVALFRATLRYDGVLAWCRALITQILKGIADVVAVCSGLSYKLLRHRARAVSGDVVLEWKRVNGGVQEAAGPHMIMRDAEIAGG